MLVFSFWSFPQMLPRMCSCTSQNSVFSASRFTGFLKTSVRVAVTSLAGALLHHVISLQQSEQTAALRPLTIVAAVAAAAAAASAKLLLSAKCCL